jgi:hypothetical protein
VLAERQVIILAKSDGKQFPNPDPLMFTFRYCHDRREKSSMETEGCSTARPKRGFLEGVGLDFFFPSVTLLLYQAAASLVSSAPSSAGKSCPLRKVRPDAG